MFIDDCSLSDSEHLVLARLCRQIGHINDAYPIGFSTSVKRENCVLAINEYLYSQIVENPGEYGIKLYETLKNTQTVVLIGGYYSTDTGLTNGHAWICDGGRRTGYYNSGLKDAEGNDIYFAGSVYFHYNWGYAGTDNGYFLSSVFNPTKAAEYDGYGTDINNTDYNTKLWYIMLKK